MSDLVIGKQPRQLGQSNLKVAPIAYGMWRFAGTGVADARAKIEAALEAGMTLFDTADIYGLDDGLPAGASEELFGKVLKEAPALRDRMVIATKCGIVPPTPYDSSPAHIRASCDASLRRMNIDTLDLFQVHRPDLLTHPADVAETLMALRSEGKIREIGLSNHTASQIRALQSLLEAPIATQQPEFSAACIDPVTDGVFDLCMSWNMTPLAWSPLAGGRLMLDPGQAATPELADTIAALDEIAGNHGIPRAVAALAWVLAHPSRPIPIIGSQTPARIAEAMAALDVTLTRTEWYKVYQAALGQPLP